MADSHGIANRIDDGTEIAVMKETLTLMINLPRQLTNKLLRKWKTTDCGGWIIIDCPSPTNQS
ncbi:MAG: hypothetical protein ACI8R4_000743 [Paracoccaceae bacterium]|jgi:hypothetical protein